MELHDKNLKEILSNSKLELPFSNFEDNMIHRIEEFERKKKAAERNRFFSHVCFLLGIILGSLLTYLISNNYEMKQFSLSSNENYSLFTQFVYVILIILFASKIWELSKFDIKKIFK